MEIPSALTIRYTCQSSHGTKFVSSPQIEAPHIDVYGQFERPSLRSPTFSIGPISDTADSLL
uniref:Uncharacterized protein n=1 Tax=Cucumis melo TaxID=3656 RepID=A0A9I9EDW2_CUCME